MKRELGFLEMTNMKSWVAGAALGTAFMLAAGSALAAVAVGDTLGTKVSEIATQLEDKGYTIREIDVSRSKIEVEVTFDGADYEIDVDRTSGTVIKIEDD
jgi:hypothetical protein